MCNFNLEVYSNSSLQISREYNKKPSKIAFVLPSSDVLQNITLNTLLLHITLFNTPSICQVPCFLRDGNLFLVPASLDFFLFDLTELKPRELLWEFTELEKYEWFWIYGYSLNSGYLWHRTVKPSAGCVECSSHFPPILLRSDQRSY